MDIKRIKNCICISAAILASCSSSEQNDMQPPIEPKSAHGARKVTTIEVPPFVQGKWESVTISILNKPEMSQKSYKVPIGGKYKPKGGDMVIEVETFLPSFIMSGATITSRSNDLRNPAAKVIITDNDKIIFQGWLFARHPNTHLPLNPSYGFALEEAHPAKSR